MNNINQNPLLVDKTLATLAKPHPNITTVKVVRQNNVVHQLHQRQARTHWSRGIQRPDLTRKEMAGGLNAGAREGWFSLDWSRILLFVIPHPRDYHGNDQSMSDAQAVMCVHPFGM